MQQLRAPPAVRMTRTRQQARLQRSRPGRRAHCRPAASGGYTPPPLSVDVYQSEAAVLAVTGLCVAYWWFVLVPGARVNLAVNKRSGRLRSYLEELKSDDSRPLQRWFYSSWLAKIDPETAFLLREKDGSVARTELSDTEGGGDRTAEETLEQVINRAKRTPRFWSLDNPVLVATALSVGGAALFGSISH
jgi:hypothetical protein